MELDGLLEANIFGLLRRSDVPENARVFKGRFVDAVKSPGITREVGKSRYVFCGYNDKGKEKVLTQAPTVTKTSVRILLSLAASLQAHGYRAKIRDISQAHTQSRTFVNRSVLAEAPEELGSGSDYVLVVLRPLYGLAEAALHWYPTYAGHHKKNIGMRKTTLDMCLFMKRSSEMLDGVVALQVDDSLILGTPNFHKLEDEKAKSFLSKAPLGIDEGCSEMFNGVDIRNGGDGYELSVASKAKTPPTDVTVENFVSRRALAACLGLWCCPMHLGKIQLLAGVGTSPQSADTAGLEKVLAAIKSGTENMLTYKPLCIKTLKVVVFANASFANNPDHTSQIGYVVALVDDDSAANVIAFASRKCRRVTRSVLAAEMLALVEAYDVAAAVAGKIGELLGRGVSVWALTDSRTLYNAVTSLGSLTEKRLMTDLADLRGEHQAGRIRIFWIESKENAADVLTKKASTGEAMQTLLSGRFCFNPNAWNERVNASATFGQERFLTKAQRA